MLEVNHKIQGKNVGENLYSFWLGKYFSDMTPKAQPTTKL